MENKTVELLQKVQSKLVAPKNQRNTFGNYNYRNCEDILEALKPILKELNCTVVVSDEIVVVGDRFYVKAVATFSTSSGDISSQAFAREPLERKGMDASQITGATSSYARKYALNGLFLIDDNKDPDSTNVHGSETKTINKTTPKQSTDTTRMDAEEAAKAWGGEVVSIGLSEKPKNDLIVAQKKVGDKEFVKALALNGLASVDAIKTDDEAVSVIASCIKLFRASQEKIKKESEMI